MADSNLPPGGTGGNPLPIAGNVSISVEDDGALVVLRLALFLDHDAATDLCLRIIGRVARLKGLGPRPPAARVG